MTRASIALAVALALIVCCAEALPCTNFLITRGASSDGSTMISYAADSHELYGELVCRPARKHPPGAMRPIYDWDTGKYLGEIPEVAETYAVVGNMNEHQVSVGETTFTGREELTNPEGRIDYGSLMFVALERARTARQAVEIMGELAEKYTFYSEGESFSISDPREVWIMEMVGKGKGGKGAAWVARRIPDGYISAHANQARIRRFPLRDSRNCLYSKDVIAFARQKGYFNGKDSEFSFADAYAPMTWKALRICEARVWAMFRRAAPSLKLSSDYIMGVEGAAPLPLWIKPDRKLGVWDVMELMRDHFEGTELDLHQGVGAGPFELPYRWRPLYWELDGVQYTNERATSTQQTGFSFVAQARSALPDPIGGVFWFGVDDTNSTVYIPMYCGIQSAPSAYAVGTADFETFSWDSAFWVFNWVSNWAYTRYRDMIPIIRREQRQLEGSFLADQPEVERAALDLYRRAPALAREYLTRYSHRQAERTVTRWRRLGQELFVKFLDGNVRDEHGKITHPPYPEHWYRRIVRERPEMYRIRRLPGEPEEKKPGQAGQAEPKKDEPKKEPPAPDKPAEPAPRR
ncbi:MAG: C69 family dipeptidase [Deltaproteobacteria bacterium]|nr:C69 family dipeptidase [Deltaproteobacteria bacterium]